MSQRRGPGIAPPKHVGVRPGADPVVQKYTRGIVERAQEARAKDRVPIPDLGAAAAQYRPDKDGPMTLSSIAQAQENLRAMNDPTDPNKAQLKPETVQGLRALHEAVAAQQGPPAPPTPPTAVEEKPAPEKKSFSKMTEEERRAATETSDIDFDLMMRRLRNDVVNNEEERKAIEAKLKDMDIADGLMSGEFRQFVPIVQGKLEVVFRSVSPIEMEEIRRKILEEVIADERIANMASEKLGFWTTVAAIHSLNGQEMPSHLKKPTKGAGREFVWDVFMSKVSLYMSYPTPLIHSLSTHAYWFDLRVRKLFTSAALKNG
jgi:hypothetical protein